MKNENYRKYYWIGWAILMFSALIIMLFIDFDKACCFKFGGWYNFFNGIYIFAFGGLLASCLK